MKYNQEALALQKMLKKEGFYHGKLDGFWGAKSKKAHRFYQEANGLLVQPKNSITTLREHRCGFTSDMAKLIAFAIKQGFECAADDVKSNEDCRVHMRGSQHYKGLAIDLLLYKDGKYLTKTEDHTALGEYWESLSSYNRWGGRYHDGNHYERLEHLWQENSKVPKKMSKPNAKTIKKAD
jgi:peptidoglycan L-alanyl-D-glutamate endopeptidase CwlK